MRQCNRLAHDIVSFSYARARASGSTELTNPSKLSFRHAAITASPAADEGTSATTLPPRPAPMSAPVAPPARAGAHGREVSGGHRGRALGRVGWGSQGPPGAPLSPAPGAARAVRRGAAGA